MRVETNNSWRGDPSGEGRAGRSTLSSLPVQTLPQDFPERRWLLPLPQEECQGGRAGFGGGARERPLENSCIALIRGEGFLMYNFNM